MVQHIVWINIDGARSDRLYPLIDSGELPWFSRIFGKGLRVERMSSIFPSVTLACQSSLFTGLWPNHHNLLGNGWLDRFQNPPVYRTYVVLHEALRIYGFKLWGFPTILLPQRKDQPLANAEINQNIPTIYEVMTQAGMESVVVYNHVSRGCTRWVRPSRLDMINFALCHENKIEFNHFENATTKRAVHAARKVKEFPRLFMVYMSGLDGYSHRHGPGTTEMYCKKFLDPMMGRIMEAVDARVGLDNCRFMLTADHGQAEVKPDKAYMLHDVDFERMIESLGRTPYWHKSKNQIEASNLIFRNEGGSMHLYVKNSKTGRWDTPPAMEDLMETADAFMKLSGKPFEHIAPDWIDLILIKDPETDKYRVWRDGALSGAEEYFADREEHYPDAAARLQGYAGPRSADVILQANYSQGFYFSDALHGGQHGSLTKEDSLVPFVVSGAGVANGTVKRGSIIDASPTAAAMLGLTIPGADGTPVAVG